ncbi:MAG: RnfABCDGE type electron transport complex subunit B [Thiomonas sp.]|uniref:RnfABCDGE type electron transport complex subunit B n=1 Tax=Thiomonas sp. TaxID=2047785 RepID=UPI002A364B8C|nr:RnfABCDGE type electron transport complex subunit B [Thiomonas sp.]MDY0331851.1 RnfABCDGE type electron transport complex subunit B [Thiomonas sp.]
MPVVPGALATQIDALLPQTQCTRCGYADCAAYAQAIAEGQADINRCPPGGAQGIEKLADLLQRPAPALDPSCGAEAARERAVIDPAQCIGCTLCIQACPVDAIAGVPKRMHTVIETWCTGCTLCIQACPVDCIHMEALADPALATRTGWDAWSPAQADEARQRHARHLQRHPRQLAQAVAAESTQSLPPEAPRPADDRKAALLQAAMERARQRQHGAV